MAKVEVSVTLEGKNPTKATVEVPKDNHGAVLTSAVEKAVQKKFAGKKLQSWTFLRHLS